MDIHVPSYVFSAWKCVRDSTSTANEQDHCNTCSHGCMSKSVKPSQQTLSFSPSFNAIIWCHGATLHGDETSIQSWNMKRAAHKKKMVFVRILFAWLGQSFGAQLGWDCFTADYCDARSFNLQRRPSADPQQVWVITSAACQHRCQLMRLDQWPPKPKAPRAQRSARLEASPMEWWPRDQDFQLRNNCLAALFPLSLIVYEVIRREHSSLHLLYI